MVDYTWTFSNCKVIQKLGDLENIVMSVDWTLTATNAIHSVSAAGTTEFSGTNPIEFVEFTSITKDQMTDWVISGISTEELDVIKSLLEKELAELNKPILVQMPLPFN